MTSSMKSDFIIYANDKKSKFLMLTKNDYMWSNCIIISLPNFVEFEDFNTKVHSYIHVCIHVLLKICMGWGYNVHVANIGISKQSDKGNQHYAISTIVLIVLYRAVM